MDLVVERLIGRCMERDPNARPASVSQLALALPGRDPLAAAIASGETPSPEMVAAAGSKEGLRPAVACGILAFIILGTLAFSLFVASIFWILYMAIEPFVRLRWPQVLISWTHLLSGDWRDRLLARDILIGCAFGIFYCGITRFLCYFVPLWFGHPELLEPAPCNFGVLLGLRQFIAGLTGTLIEALRSCLGLLGLFFLLRVLLRNQKAAIAALIAIALMLVPSAGSLSGAGMREAGSIWLILISLLVNALFVFTNNKCDVRMKIQNIKIANSGDAKRIFLEIISIFSFKSNFFETRSFLYQEATSPKQTRAPSSLP